LVVVSNSSVASSIKLIAEGYIIREVEQFKLYASNGNAGGGVVATINTNSGEAEVLGESHYKPLRSITINPTNNSLYALSGSAYDESPTILILTSQDGSGYPVGAADIALDAIAFDNNGVLYGAGADNNLYILNLDDSTSTFVGDIPIRFAAITFSHDNNEMYATSRSNASRDLIMKVNVETGDTTHVGRTGRNKVMFGLAFDNNGTLYAAEGTDYQVSDIITINPETGEGELLGSSGIKGITGLSFAMDGIVDVENEPGIVAKFELKQNYPNPFNPETTIKYSLAHSSNVVLKVYDMLGREITTLVSAQQGAGNYSVKFNASNLASGMYIYRLQADGVTLSKKMLLLK
jgi:sugar lactone lactonase YvrE